MVDVVRAIVASLVDDPEDIEVSEVSTDHTVVIEVNVHPEDRGRIIGRNGVIADSIRTILKAASGRNKKHYILEIVQGEEDFGDEPDVSYLPRLAR